MTLENARINLRPYRRTDLPAIREIYAHYVQNTTVTFDLDVPEEDEMAQKFERFEQAGHPLFVTMSEETLLGFAYASTYRSRPAYRFTCENSIYLAPASTGHGLGSLMMGELLEQSRAFGFNQMIAIITAGTLPSIALHEKFGFQVLGRFPELGFKFNKWHDIIHMQLKLQKPDRDYTLIDHKE